MSVNECGCGVIELCLSTLMIYAKDCDPTSWLKKDLTVYNKLCLFLCLFLSFILFLFGILAKSPVTHCHTLACNCATSLPVDSRLIYALFVLLFVSLFCCSLLTVCCSVAFDVRWMFDLSPDYRTKCHRLQPRIRIRIRIPIRYQFSFKPPNTKCSKYQSNLLTPHMLLVLLLQVVDHSRGGVVTIATVAARIVRQSP